MTDQEFEKATEGITYNIVESMESTEIVNHRRLPLVQIFTR